jgi:hypothetical protein
MLRDDVGGKGGTCLHWRQAFYGSCTPSKKTSSVKARDVVYRYEDVRWGLGEAGGGA